MIRLVDMKVLTFILIFTLKVPDGELTPEEECLRDLAKPQTATEAQLFQLLASIRFGLTDSVINSIDMLTAIVQNYSLNTRVNS